MSNIITRKIKKKQYLYLEESFKSGKKWVKESIYLGSEKPTQKELLKAFEELKNKCIKKKHIVLVQPLTEFIANETAVELEDASENKEEYFGQLTKTHKEQFAKRERITFITDSNAIEGSSLTYSETENLLEHEKRIRDAKRRNIIITGLNREQQEALNLKVSLDYYDKYLRINEKISERLILQLHYLLLDNISGYEKYQGIYRPVKVYIVGSSHEFPLPHEVPYLMQELVKWHEENEELIHPVELAAKFHTKFTSIHPFADGNGRMARLLMNYILQQKEMPFTNIPLAKREAYMITQAEGNKENYKPFTRFLANEIIEQHLKKLRLLEI
ncbi:MAG: hypothetical protein COT15_04810 [Candidatus Diapherotrites archaeon CG08_land_8_20_14_0_20_34_12]|nr:MAG: hypothetical protein COT15_04810 [Candidatus Diapherotrites archaeon CG08_land_8_20_14_0_20_34_12]